MHRPTHVQISLGQIAGNYRAIERHVGGVQLMPILKANAYGHGLEAVAARLEREGARCFGVAYVEEGIALRKAGVSCSILVLGGIIGRQIPLFLEHDLILTASSVDKLRAIEEAATAFGRKARVHLKIDTGMERIGIHWYSAGALLEESLRCPHVAIEGIYSHLACSDGEDPGPTALQLERFQEVLRFYERRSLPTPTRHLANSGAILQAPETWLDLVRPGILIYGVHPSAEVPRLSGVAPAMRWCSHVVYFKVVQAGHPVSYGWTWQSDVATRVITVPVGYGDGYFRAMSGKAEVIVRGQKKSVVGRICMDQLMVNLEAGEAYNGDEVVLLGEQGEARITAEDLAGWAGTIPYEILTNVHARVPRVYSDE